MANHTLNRIKGAATAKSAPFDSISPSSGSLPRQDASLELARNHTAQPSRYHQSSLLMRRLCPAVLAAVALLAATAGSTSAQSWVVNPASPSAELISQLFWFT